MHADGADFVDVGGESTRADVAETAIEACGARQRRERRKFRPIPSWVYGAGAFRRYMDVPAVASTGARAVGCP
jgi:hypothetical protein